MKTFYAHSTESGDKTSWQLLEDHLRNVADLASSFAEAFGATRWAELSGSLHDAGKATSAFLRRLEGNPVKVDHATFGARLATEKAGRLGMLLAYVITGHHGGMPDGGEQVGQLHYRLKYGKVADDTELISPIHLEKELLLPFRPGKDIGFSLSFFARMLFSCLVDADFLDTEAFCNPTMAGLRREPVFTDLFCRLKKRFDAHLAEKIGSASPTHVNELRRKILEQCRKKAQHPQGVFSLTVPTGGGKTYSSLAFALDHAVTHGMNRIIYVIPFTSIIEQNAKVFEQALGNENVLEHHCNYRERDEPEETGYEQRRGLAAENWSAPVVVTTNVQFFESLYSNKPSRCRKLHNIAGSVIILDEAQAIPVDYLEPCVMVLKELVTHYRCTVVLCTATQPALDEESSLRNRLSAVSEIVENPQELFEKLSRTEVEFVGKLSDGELVDLLGAEQQVLCILSTKRQTREIFERLDRETGVFHLSTNMYPEHRRSVLAEIRTRLATNEPCKVISTSLVEAGVDLDFPTVFRAMAGLDSIAQAAGRCNREGKMGCKGRVVVFEAESAPSMPWLKRCMSRAAETLRAMPYEDPLGMVAMRRYFHLLYDVEDTDKKKIVSRLNLLTKDLYFPFDEIGREFRLIEEDSVGVIIPLEVEVEEHVNTLRHGSYHGVAVRKLQQYSVSVRSKDFTALNTAGALEMVNEVFPVLRNLRVYDRNVGLCVDRGEVWNTEDLIS